MDQLSIFGNVLRTLSRSRLDLLPHYNGPLEAQDVAMSKATVEVDPARAVQYVAGRCVHGLTPRRLLSPPDNPRLLRPLRRSFPSPICEGFEGFEVFADLPGGILVQADNLFRILPTEPCHPSEDPRSVFLWNG